MNERPRPSRPAARLALAAFTLLALTALPGTALGQWTTGTGTLTTTNNVGVGTSSPGAKLDLVGATSDATAGALKISNSAAASIFFVRNDGNVGVGTASPDARLSVGGKLRMFDTAPTGSGSDAGYMFGSVIPSGLVTEAAGELLTYGINVPQVGARSTARVGGLFRLDTRASEQRFVLFGYPTGGSVAADRFSVNLQNGNVVMAGSGGSVGVGTAAPASIFSVNLNNSDYTNSGGAGAHFVMTNPNAAGQNVVTSIINGATVAKWRTDYQGNISWVAGATGRHDFYTGGDYPTGTAKMTVLNNGNVGIGTGTPAYRLDVVGQLNSSGGLCIAGDCKTAWSQVGGASQWATSGANISYGAGNVGVGTASPNQRLGVQGMVGVYPQAFVQPTGRGLFMFHGGTGAGIYAYNYPGGGADPLALSASTLSFSTYVGGAGHERVTVTNDGRVGIGTTNPQKALDVNGDINVSGNINAKYQDLAEWVEARERLSAGTVVVLDTEANDRVMASSSPYDTRVAGVVSAQPGLILGEAGDTKVKVATTGRVMVRVDATKGPIRIGDLLVTSGVPGVAMKSEPVQLGGRAFHTPGTIIGKALEPLEKGVGEIKVLLSLQ